VHRGSLSRSSLRFVAIRFSSGVVDHARVRPTTSHLGPRGPSQREGCLGHSSDFPRCCSRPHFSSTSTKIDRVSTLGLVGVERAWERPLARRRRATRARGRLALRQKPRGDLRLRSSRVRLWDSQHRQPPQSDYINYRGHSLCSDPSSSQICSVAKQFVLRLWGF
jgi:hypothetical protein